jgi:hypothetical protein
VTTARAARRILRRQGMPLEEISVVHRVLGQPDAPPRRLAEATALIAARSEPLFVVPIVFHHAILALDAGLADRSAILVGAAERVVDEYDVHFPEWALAFFGDPARQAREALGDAAYRRRVGIGHRMTLEEALGFIQSGAQDTD